MFNFSAVTFIHGRNVTFSYARWRMLPMTAVDCQWWKPEFVVGCERVNIGHDQPWELFPAGAGMLSCPEVGWLFVALSADASFKTGQVSCLEDTFGLGFCFP